MHERLPFDGAFGNAFLFMKFFHIVTDMVMTIVFTGHMYG